MSKAKLSDEEIIRLLRSANEADRKEACGYLYASLKPKTKKWLSKYGVRNTIVEDIFHDAFIDFTTQNTTFVVQRQGSIEAYFSKIVYAYSAKEYQVLSNNVSINEFTEYDFEDNSSKSIDEIIDRKLKIQTIQEEMSKLNPLEINLLTKFYFNNIPLVDLVNDETLNLGNYNNAKNRLFEYRNKLFRLFNKQRNG